MISYLDDLIHITSTEHTKNLSGEPKRIFRYLLVGIFINTIEINKEDQSKAFRNSMKREEYIGIAKAIIKTPLSAEIFKDLFLDDIQKNMENKCFYNLDKTDVLSNINKFFREKLKYLKDGRRFWRVEEFEKVFSVVDYLKSYNIDIPVKSHHWIDFNIRKGLVLTYPELITYNDLIVSWNLILEKMNKYHLLLQKNGINEIEVRQAEYEIASLHRYCYISCVTFFESYLFYLFYNLKSKEAFKNEAEIKRLYDSKHTKVNDSDILENIIEPKFIESQDQQKYKMFFEKYSKLNNIRNSVIHTSAFEDLSNKLLSMELFMSTDIDLDILKKEYQLVIDFTLFIESSLPEEDKILFWWDTFEYPDFNSKKEIKRTRV